MKAVESSENRVKTAYLKTKRNKFIHIVINKK